MFSTEPLSRSRRQSRHGSHCRPPWPAEPQCTVPGAAEGASTLCPAHLPASSASDGHHRFAAPSPSPYPHICPGSGTQPKSDSWFTTSWHYGGVQDTSLVLLTYLLPFLIPSPTRHPSVFSVSLHFLHFSDGSLSRSKPLIFLGYFTHLCIASLFFFWICGSSSKWSGY